MKAHSFSRGDHMKISFRVLALTGASFCALGIAASASPSFAATAPDVNAADASAGVGLSEVIVTAQKRSENLEKTPISISVMNNQDLVNRHIQSLTDLIAGGVPGLTVTPYASRPFNLILNIRGVGVMTDTNQPARDSGVGVYVDGVYLGRPQGLDAALYDVDNIEVLKGPQGTLFGRNTEGGAVDITTKKPTGQFGLDVTGGVGNFGSYEDAVHLNLPEYHDFSLKVDGIITSRDGAVKNPLAGASDYGAYDRRGVHVQLQWRPTPNFTANYSYDNSYDASTTLYSQVVQAGTSPIAPILPVQPNRVDSATVGIPLQPSIGRQSGHTLNLEWDVSPALKIKSISSYRELYQNQWQDSASGAVFTPNAQFARYSLAEFEQYQYSEELQAIGEISTLKYVVGALVYHEHVDDMAQTFNAMQFNANGTAATLVPLGTNITPVNIDIPILFPHAGIDRASRVSSDSYGLYGQATYTPPIFDDIFHLTGGLRWTDDVKNGQLYIVNNAVPVNAFGQSGVLGLDKSWSRVDPMVNLAIDVTPDVQAYVKWGTGYRSGGANSRSLSYLAFGPEEITMSEIGAKSEFFDHRLRFNIAAYTGVYKNFQVDFTAPYYSFDANGNVIVSASTTRTTTNTVNAPGTGQVDGVETDFMLAPMQGLTLSGSYTYAYVHLPPTINPFPVFVPGVGTVVNTTPITIYQEFTPADAVTGAIDYQTPFEQYTLRAHLDGNWDSGSYSTDRDPSPTLRAIKSQPGLVFNGRIALGDIKLDSGATLTLSLWSRNLLDEQHLYTRTNSITSGITGTFNDPRTFGFEGNVKF
jgi:iron complex outermembrane recepter protein